MQVAYAGSVKISSARHLRRRERLNALVLEAGGPTALAARVGTPKTHISALQAGNRGVGDKLAAKLEAKMTKPPGWMDADSLELPGDTESELSGLTSALREIRSLDQVKFQQLADNVRALLAAMRETSAILSGQTPETARESLPRRQLPRGTSVFGELDALPMRTPEKKHGSNKA